MESVVRYKVNPGQSGSKAEQRGPESGSSRSGMASSTGESGQGLAKARRPQSQGVPLIVFSDNEQPTQSQDTQRTRSDVREGQNLPQEDKPSHEAVLEDMISDTPMVSPVQSIKPSPASKKTPVTGVQSGDKVRSASASSSGSAKPAQSGGASNIIDLEGAVNVVPLIDYEQAMEVDDTTVNPNDYRKSHVESVSDGEEQPPDHDSNNEYDDDPDFNKDGFGYQKRSTAVHGTHAYLQALSASLDAAITYQTD